MRLKTVALASALCAAAALTVASAPASAYTACNHEGDCWHVDSRVHIKGVRLSFHPDTWWDKLKNKARYHFHDADNDHDWHKGYWAKGEWHVR